MAEEKGMHWYVAFCRNGQWAKIGRRLEELNIDCFIPDVYRTLVFLRTTKPMALTLVNSGAINVRYMIDSATRTLMTVPEKQMEDFRRVLDCSPDAECITEIPFSAGGRVRVAKGPLRGVEGEVLEIQDGHYLLVKVCTLLCAKVEIPKNYLVALPQ